MRFTAEDNDGEERGNQCQERLGRWYLFVWASSNVLGSIAGLFGRVLEHPFDSIKVRLQTSESFNGVFDCFGKTIKNEGSAGLYKVCLVQSSQSTLDTSCWIPSFSTVNIVFT